jgi:hypothetical protein
VSVPQEVAAEQAVLAAVLQSRSAAEIAFHGLAGEHFYQPRHTVIFEACKAVHERGAIPDPVSVLGELQSRKQLSRVGGAPYLHSLFTAPGLPVQVAYYARQVKDAHRLRHLLGVAERIVQQVTDSGDVEETMTAVAKELVSAEVVLDERGWDQPIDGLSTWADFLAGKHEGRDWLVPGSVARQDVVMILGTGGTGKSTLGRQVALCAAAGWHPFSASAITPRRTLVVDLENAADVLADEVRDVHRAVQMRHADNDFDGRAWVWHRPGGINLRQHAHAAELERVIAETGAELVAFGPLYKAAIRGRDDWDTAANEVREVFDRLRERYRIGLWFEHHMPKPSHGQAVSGTPYGSATWEWWTSVGRVLVRDESLRRPVYQLRPMFRADRGVHDGIPFGLERRSGWLPWSPIWSEEDYKLIAEGAA